MTLHRRLPQIAFLLEEMVLVWVSSFSASPELGRPRCKVLKPGLRLCFLLPCSSCQSLYARGRNDAARKTMSVADMRLSHSIDSSCSVRPTVGITAAVGVAARCDQLSGLLLSRGAVLRGIVTRGALVRSEGPAVNRLSGRQGPCLGFGDDNLAEKNDQPSADCDGCDGGHTSDAMSV